MTARAKKAADAPVELEGGVPVEPFERLCAIVEDCSLRLFNIGEVFRTIEEMAGDVHKVEAVAACTQHAVDALQGPLRTIVQMARELRNGRPS